MLPAPPPPFPPSDLPPPPTAPTAVPGPRGVRPGWVTAAAVILIVLGSLGMLAGIVLVGSRDVTGFEELVPREGAVAVGVLTILVSGLEVVAGILVLRRSNAGRILGVVLAGFGVFGGIASLGASGGSGAIGLVLHGLVLYGLIAYARAFRPGGGG
jgi:hypothetical protein